MIPQTVYGLRPISEAGKQWVKENIQAESWQWLGDAIVIENRYLSDIVEGMIADGLEPDIDFEA